MPPSSLYGSRQSADYSACLRNVITYLLNIVRDNPHQRLPKASTRTRKEHAHILFYAFTLGLRTWIWIMYPGICFFKKKCTSRFEMSLLFIDYTSKANIIYTLCFFFFFFFSSLVILMVKLFAFELRNPLHPSLKADTITFSFGRTYRW